MFALLWNKVAPHDLQFPNLVMAENPHPNGAFETDSKMEWWRDVRLCDEMKPLALLGTLVDKTCSQDEKCARLQISAGKLEEVEKFLASFLSKDMGNSLRSYLEPRDKGTSGAVSTSNEEIASTAEVLTSFKAGSMFPYFSHAFNMTLLNRCFFIAQSKVPAPAKRSMKVPGIRILVTELRHL